jgi:Na+/H+ antiporter NhaD/arsenite permease-like protein
MVWQAGLLDFFDFFHLFLPSAVTYLVPAACMHFAVPAGSPETGGFEGERMKTGGAWIVVLFALTLVTAVSFQHFLGLPPVMGMMLGLGYLKGLAYFLQRSGVRQAPGYGANEVGDPTPFDVFRYVARAEWDTLLFFYGVILCVGGVAAIGYLDMLSDVSYTQLGPTTTNVLVGIASAVIDNIPIMAAVIQMSPDMSHGQWLLVTLTAGVGGSLLSVGSAAGVALMGQARGHYTFFRHLPWAPAIGAGYAAGIWVHLLINQRFF